MTEQKSNENVKNTKYLFQYSEKGEVQPMTEEGYQPNDMENVPENVWSVQGIWNESVNVVRQEPKERNHISFGDIGKTDYWSRFQKMKGVEETNPFDERILRIFQAGDEFHDLIKTVFKKAGLFIDSQDDLDENGKKRFSVVDGTDDTLIQLGMYDILVGGVPDKENALDWIEQSDLPTFAREKAKNIVNYFADKFPNGVKPMIYEVKSINSNAFWAKKGYLHEAYPHHRCQLYGYLLANYNNEETLQKIRDVGIKEPELNEGRLLYISKDDLVMAEFPILLNDTNLSKMYWKDVKDMSYYIMNDIEPLKPSYVVFDPRKTLSFQKNKIGYKVRGCYVVNWEVVRSPYFKLMTNEDSIEKWKSSLKDEIKTKNDKIKEIVINKAINNG